MQRTEADGVIISCDFCGTDWDQVLTMIEGHHGSVLCSKCFDVADVELCCQEGQYSCTLCLRENLPQDLPRWSPDPRPSSSNQKAIACRDCLTQAARTFQRDRSKTK
jgi:hypothetical protein